ncbi:M4 family metallopeptidase [Dyadobacter crusticola]|uniref:M4 family metallopeptidase n=1 Tax=Dyadobacter crusticola TaxID=292407 RepID=UPI0004E14767|nr:M4 family metallopeptidase [Dyadobacter crusticola]
MNRTLHFPSKQGGSVPITLFRLFLFFVLLTRGESTVFAQDEAVKPPSYPKVNYDPLQPPPPNKFGVLYNSQNFQVQVPTTYYGMQSVWLKAYLPFIESEYDPLQAPLPFGAHYTTALALCSPRDPSLSLWAPIEITAIEDGDFETAIESPFASVLAKIPPQLVHTGSFSLLSNLNEEGNPLTPNPILSTYGTSALHIAQRFTQFTHTFLGHDGLDKSGQLPIKIALRKSALPEIVGGRFVFNAETAGGISRVSKSTLAYSLANGLIIAHLPSALNSGSEAVSLTSVFSQVVDLAFVNWENSTKKFINPSWVLGEDVLPSGYATFIPFDNPKQHNVPSTYKGTYWVDGADLMALNSSVGKYLFYLLNNAKVGYPDDDTSKELFVTEPLIPGDKHATYELALKLFYDALVPGLNASTTYPDFRKMLLSAAVSNGHPVGSPVYKRIMIACYAVGIGALPFTSNPDCAITKEAESWFNGPVSFHAQEVTLTEDPASARAFQLIDCTSESRIETVEFDPLNPLGQSPFINITPLQSNLYGKDQNLLKSKVGVSVHAFSGVARDWFRSNFQHSGMDGEGKVSLINTVGDPSGTIAELWHSDKDAYLFYPYQPESACKDEVFRTYALTIQLCRDFPVAVNLDYSEDARIWKSGLANIFALEMKKDQERAKQNPNAESIWTLFEEISPSTPMTDFSQPKLYGQPAVYHGANWSATSARHNAGFIQFFYYLLVHGTEGVNGYTNDEPGSLTYFVNKMPRELALRVLWDASRSISYNAGIEEFRQATMTALHADPQYGPKSKEHITLFDAWATVLELPDYASTLAHSPEDDAVVYPWPVKVGVEVEYPMYESYRLFEVSESATFNESEAPVYRFVSNQAPELMTGMTYGQINLKPGRKYTVHSHLVDGPGARQHCAGTDDPAFCESLLNKKKWTLPFSITTQDVPAVTVSQPLQAAVVPAWSTQFTFGSTPGAAGYDIHVMDDVSPVTGHLIPVDVPYDEDKFVVNTELALSKQKGYTYKIAARQKLGSEWAVHVLPNGTIVNFTDEEKKNFPTIYGAWSNLIWFKTDVPTIKLNAPSNYSKVPLFGEDVRLMATKLSPNSADYYQLYVKDPLYQALAQDTSAVFTDFTLHIPDLLELNNDKEYTWAIIPTKKPTAPFILKEEEGAVSEWFHFTTEAELAPKPDIGGVACVNAGKEVQLSWKPIPGVEAYQYSIYDPLFQNFIVMDRVEGDTKSPVIYNASVYPGPYLRSVRGAVKNSDGVWLLGPAASAFYFIVPPSPSNLSPNNVNGVQLGSNNSVQLTWTRPPGVTNVRLFAKIEGGATLIDTEVLGNTFTLENLPFDEDVSWFVSSIGTDKSCESKEVGATFHTEGAPIVPELNFNFSLLCFDSFGLPGPVADYNLVIRDPNGNVIFSKMGLKSHFSNPKGVLPVANGIYKVDALITKADPIYLKTPASEGSVNLQMQLWDIGTGNQELDSDFQGGFFEPVTNLQFHFLFEVNLADHTIHHRSAAEPGAKIALRVYGFEVKYPEVQMTVFPNPASSEVELMPGLYKKGLQHPLEIFDQQGRAVLNVNWEGEKVDISNLTEGTYIVRVRRGELTFTQKLIVNK